MIKCMIAPKDDERIAYLLEGRVWCDRLNEEIENRRVLHKSDLVWVNIFGSEENVDSFLEKGKAVEMKVALSDLSYDRCDRILGGNDVG